MRSARILTVTLCSILLLSSATEASARVSLTDADTEAVRRTMNQYVSAWLAGDADRVMSLLTADSVLVPGEKQPFVGATAIREYWFPANAPPTVLIRFVTTVDQVQGSGDIAIVRGTQVIEWRTGTQRFGTHGNYTTVLKRTWYGWRITLQMAGNSPAEVLN